MKKSYSFLGMVAIVTMVAMVAYHSANVCVNSSTLSEVMLNENIEALAQSPESPSLFRLFPCYHSSATECVYSNDENRPACSTLTYC